ncbi:MAG: class I SAM-dependent methyltransferase [Pleurocapsa sp. SU_196_0]|nr:class I SAM-dependent methyltransferase [Pleurocapsa sp. SU_196_0]
MIDSQEQFNPLAQNYVSSHVHRFGPSLPVLLDFAAPGRGDVALDIATGTGNTALALAPFVEKVTGIDLATRMLEGARTRALEEGVTNADFQIGSAERLPFADSSFSLVTSRHAPHHFRDVPQFLSEVVRVLRPGGRFVMADQITLEPHNQAWVDAFQRTRDPSHHQQRTQEEWQALTRAAGLTWTQNTLVPYRLEFQWWTQMSGCTPERVAALTALLETAPEEIRLERNPDGSPLAHHEPMLVVRLEKLK